MRKNRKNILRPKDTKPKYKAIRIHNHPLFSGYHRVGIHRLVMAEYLGRSLLRSEHVHHKDEDTLNNQIDNLEIMECGKHSSLHMKGNKYLLGHKHSAETRRKMSFNNKRAMRGEHHTVEVKMKMSLARKDYCLQQKFPGL